jgi:hypothetical protein
MGTFDQIKKDIMDAMKAGRESGTSAYDTEAEVIRTSGSIAWVHIPGGVDETPVKMTIHSEPGDKVQVRVSGGSAWLVGNETAPPTDDTTAIEAKLKSLEADLNAKKAMQSAEDAALLAQSNAARMAEAVIAINSDIENLQDQIDGNITTWYYAYAPTLSNEPASTWTTTEEKNNHIGDIFYNSVTGYSYRFMLNGSNYEWVRISDEDISAALEAASAAQDTADHKRRVFIARPTVPYDKGDLWCVGLSGDILTCTNAKTSSQSYAASDWSKLNKYTDDTVANAAAQAAADAQQSANSAAEAAQTAWNHADEANTAAIAAGNAAESAQSSADSALQSASTANTAANSALTQLSVVEDVVDVLNWISEHGTYKATADTKVVEGKYYFTRSGTSPNYTYNVVTNPTGNPKSKGYYELDSVDEAVSNYISSHLALTNQGLWVINDNSSYKILLASDGMKVYDGEGNLVSTFGESITFSSTRPQTIGNASSYVKFYKDGSTWKIAVVADSISLGSNAVATETYADGKASTAEATAKGYADTQISNVESRIQQTTDSISSRVTKTEAKISGHYATSSTAAGTAAKVATITPATSDWELYTGATITVKFSTANTHASPTLNVNGKGAKAIKSYTGANLSEAEYKWKAGSALTFVYNGTNWLMQDSGVVERVASAETSISQNADAIALRATKTEAQGYANTAESNAKTYADSAVSTAKAEIKVTTDGISTEVAKKVGNDEIISKINQSAETVQIEASRVEIDGTVTFNAIKSKTDAAYDAKGAASAAETASKTYADGKASTAESNAKSYADSVAGTAESNAKAYADTAAGGANAREQLIYISKATGTTSVSANTTWVTNATGNQNVWTTKRPEYSKSYPVLFVATQRQTVSQTSGTACTCTTPMIDNTNTVIDGGNIITGTVTANQLNAADINASKTLTIGAFQEDTQEDILNSNVQIGGRNLIHNTLIPDVTSYNTRPNIGGDSTNGYAYGASTGTITTATHGLRHTVTSASRPGICFGPNNVNIGLHGLETGKTYTLSFDWTAKLFSGSAPAGTNYYLRAILGYVPAGSSSYNTSTYKNIHVYRTSDTSDRGTEIGDHGEFTFELPAGATAMRLYITTNSTQASYYKAKDFLELRNIKLEVGNKSTDWTPAPEDVDANIEEASKNATSYIVADSTGLMVADMSGGAQTPSTVTTNNVLIDSDSVDIRNGQTTLASFSANKIELGKGNRNASIEFCEGHGSINYISHSYDDSGDVHVASDDRLILSGADDVLLDGWGGYIGVSAEPPTMFPERQEGHLFICFEDIEIYNKDETIFNTYKTADVTNAIPVTLYDKENAAANESVTLSETAANFKRLTIFFKDTDNNYSSVDVWSPNGKRVSLSLTWINGASTQEMYQRVRWVTISGTTISTYRASASEKYRTGQVKLGATASVTNSDYIAIVHVVGYR